MRAESSAGGLSPSREEGRPSQLTRASLELCGRRQTTWLRGGPGRNVSVSIFHDALKALLGPNVDLPSTDGSEWPIVAPEAAERGGERSGHVLPVGRRGRTTPTSPFERSDRRLRMAVYILGLLWIFRRAALRASLGRGLRRPVSLGAIAWPEVASFRLDHGCCSRW